QAEDGIRDPLVTGVQTCALPISIAGRYSRSRQFNLGRGTVTVAISNLPLPLPFRLLSLRIRLNLRGSGNPIDRALQKAFLRFLRSEERRVGKECRYRCM